MSRQDLQVEQMNFTVPADAAGWQRGALIVGVLGAIGCVIGGFLQLDTFLRGYLIAYMFWTGLSLGCLALLMAQYLSAGLWGLVIRRFLEAGARVLPLMGVLFFPILFLRTHLYGWMLQPVKENHWYLNTPNWIARYVLYFAIWFLLTFGLTSWSKRLDQRYEVYPRFQALSGAGSVLLALTLSFAAVDWVMCLDPHWGSTIYGLIFLVGDGLAALCFSIIMLTVVTRYEPYAEIVKPMQFHDIGKLTLAFVMLFAYFSFSQWLIIWSGNLPDEISWYLQRIRGYWGYIILAIVLFHFALPFAMLLSRDLKRAGRRLVPLALLLMFMRLVDIYWYVIPNFKHVVIFSIWYVIAPIGLGGLWLAYFFYNLRQRPLLPAYDPQMPLFLNQRHEH
ncbi:MAG: hypothetical protein WAM71_05145 [Candidatus Korobacteraceae bacterium]